MNISPPICVKCERLIAPFRCEPFPDGIPRPILDLEHDHRKPYRGDNGLTFKAKKTTSGPFPNLP